MGCTIHLEDLRRYFPAKCTVAQLKRATPIGLGMLSQFGLMPLIAFLLGHVFNLTPAEHISAIIIGCTPGGTTSNLFAYWCNGDTGLSIAMTVCSTFIALFAQVGLIKLYVCFYAAAAASATLCPPRLHYYYYYYYYYYYSYDMALLLPTN